MTPEWAVIIVAVIISFAAVICAGIKADTNLKTTVIMYGKKKEETLQ
jgi:hypothetical protein